MLAEDVVEFVTALRSPRVQQVLQITLQCQQVDVGIEPELLAGRADICVAEEPFATAEVVHQLVGIELLPEDPILQQTPHRVDRAEVILLGLEADGVAVVELPHCHLGYSSELMVPELVEHIVLVLVHIVVNH